MVKKVVIVGAGPSGLLLAHYLLRRGSQYQVELCDRRPDPRQVPFSTARTFPLTLNPRGMKALQAIPPVEAAVRAASVEIQGTFLHQGNGKARYIPRKKPFVSLDRTSLVMVLLETLSQQYDASRLSFQFDCACTKLDFVTKQATFQSKAGREWEISYDLLIGADGARSVVRGHLLNTERFEFEQKYVLSDYRSLLLSSTNAANLQANAIHTWRSPDGTAIIAVPQPDQTLSGVIHFPHDQNAVANLASPEAVKAFFQQNFPEVGALMSDAEVQAFLKRPIASVLTVRCNRYHYGDSVLIVGDAAHAVSPSLGQGCNAALEDGLVLDRLLDQYQDTDQDNVAGAIAQFTVQRQADAHALAELSDHAFPLAKPMFAQMLLRESTAKLMHRFFPKQFSPSLLNLLMESTASYADILRLNQKWVEKVKRSNQRFLKTASQPSDDSN